jgi:hypothetical protein
MIIIHDIDTLWKMIIFTTPLSHIQERIRLMFTFLIIHRRRKKSTSESMILMIIVFFSRQVGVMCFYERNDTFPFDFFS